MQQIFTHPYQMEWGLEQGIGSRTLVAWHHDTHVVGHGHLHQAPRPSSSEHNSNPTELLILTNIS